MKPTRWVVLFAIAAVGLGIGWVAVELVERIAGRVLGVPWIAPAALWILALAVLVWAVVSRPSLVDDNDRNPLRPVTAVARTSVPTKPDRKRMPPLAAARTAALALAASRTGAIIGGFYLGIALALIPVRGTPSGSTSMTASVVAVLACAVLTGAAVWLESMCRIRHDD